MEQCDQRRSMKWFTDHQWGELAVEWILDNPRAKALALFFSYLFYYLLFIIFLGGQIQSFKFEQAFWNSTLRFASDCAVPLLLYCSLRYACTKSKSSINDPTTVWVSSFRASASHELASKGDLCGQLTDALRLMLFPMLSEKLPVAHTTGLGLHGMHGLQLCSPIKVGCSSGSFHTNTATD